MLGSTGHNFGVGLTAGHAFVLDDARRPLFLSRLNDELVHATRVEDETARITLRRMVGAHHLYPQSPLAAELLVDWDAALARFWHVRPNGCSGPGKWMTSKLSSPTRTNHFSPQRYPYPGD